MTNATDRTSVEEIREALVAAAETPYVSGLHVHVVTATGSPATIDFRLRRDTVEIWCGDHRAGVTGRQALRAWLASPTTTKLRFDDVALHLDRIVDRYGRVAITLPDVDAWTLAPIDLEALHHRI